MLPGGETEPVVVVEFLYAAFRDGGTEFRNRDPRGKDYRAELGETGVIHDFRAELRGIDLW